MYLQLLMLKTKINFVISIILQQKSYIIATKLITEIPPYATLEEIRDFFADREQSVTRIHLLTLQDIHNIATKCNVDVPYMYKRDKKGY